MNPDPFLMVCFILRSSEWGGNGNVAELDKKSSWLGPLEHIMENDTGATWSIPNLLHLNAHVLMK